uniref:Uncharacterized protein n=1 Tax=Noccaea caerulescens TaxID=107243 RepID=A0A1J3FQP5_NOCCA
MVADFAMDLLQLRAHRKIGSHDAGEIQIPTEKKRNRRTLKSKKTQKSPASDNCFTTSKQIPIFLPLTKRKP